MTISYDELMDYGQQWLIPLRKSMTLSINNEFDWEGSKSRSAFLRPMIPNQTYPAFSWMMGTWISSIPFRICDFSGLDSKNRLDDYTPWKASALRDGAPRFWRSGKCLSWPFIWRSFRQVAVALSPGQNHLAYGGYSLGGLASTVFSILTRSLYLLYLWFLLVSWFYDLLQGRKAGKSGLFAVFTEWSNRRGTSYQSLGSSTSLCLSRFIPVFNTLSD